MSTACDTARVTGRATSVSVYKHAKHAPALWTIGCLGDKNDLKGLFVSKALEEKRKELEDASHHDDCASLKPGIVWRECDCWKREAWRELQDAEAKERAAKTADG